MDNYLQIEWHPDDDFSDEIYVDMVSGRFSARGGAYYTHRAFLADFGNDLDRYPIEPGKAPELFIGYARQVEGVTEAVFDIPELRIRIEPIDRRGGLAVTALIKDSMGGQLAELRMETSYGALQTFREQLRAAEGPPMHGTARLE